MRDDLEVDAGLVHFLDAQFAEVVEALFERRDAKAVAGVKVATSSLSQ